jgi:hypothetical protein
MYLQILRGYFFVWNTDYNSTKHDKMPPFFTGWNGILSCWVMRFSTHIIFGRLFKFI